MNQLINEIIEVVLGGVDCHHEVDHEEDGAHMSVEYNLNNETLIKLNIEELIKESMSKDKEHLSG